MHDYPSDITREQFKIIRSDLEQAKRHTTKNIRFIGCFLCRSVCPKMWHPVAHAPNGFSQMATGLLSFPHMVMPL